MVRLKTRDLQVMFKDYENDKGGFRIKWVDDTNALVVFADAGVGAYIPPPCSRPSQRTAWFSGPIAGTADTALRMHALSRSYCLFLDTLNVSTTWPAISYAYNRVYHRVKQPARSQLTIQPKGHTCPTSSPHPLPFRPRQKSHPTPSPMPRRSSSR